MPFRIRRKFLSVLFCLSFAFANTAWAQSIIAVVNDDLISQYDLEQRIMLLLRSAGMEDTPENKRDLARNAMSALIDERLQLAEAARAGITVSDADLEGAHAIVARQLNVTPARLPDFLRSQGIEMEAFNDKLRAEVAWNTYVGKRIATKVKISEEEVDEAFSLLRGKIGEVQLLLSEILLPVSGDESTASVVNQANALLREMRKGAGFEQIARQFSVGMTASRGGDLGWVNLEQLADPLQDALRDMPQNSVSTPIETRDGIHIMFVRDRRTIGQANPKASKLHLMQILFAANTNIESEKDTAITRAKTFQARFKTCSDVKADAQALGADKAVDLGTLRVGDMPQALQDSVINLPQDGISEPIIATGNVMLLAVCTREDMTVKLPDREQLRRQMEASQTAQRAQSYLRQLRQTAVIEER